jgi:tetratricopeptide (TPR) repeat protein
MSDNVSVKPQRRSLRDIFEQIDAADNPELEFINLVLNNASQMDSELPGLLRACAIPRRFDEPIIGVLRHKTDDHLRNQQLLAMVCGHRFVLMRQDGAYVYHDNTRDTLLEDWLASEEKRQQFVDLNERLAAFYEAEHAHAVQAEQDLARAAIVMRRANSARYRQLSSLIEKRFVAPLLEALYHRLLASPADGFEFFRDRFHEQEEARRYTACQSLLDATRDFLQRLPLAQQNQQQFNWLDYFEARLLRQLLPYDFEKAESKLRTLLQSEEGESKLRLWVLDELSVVLEYQLKLREAIQRRKELTALTERTGEDVYNLPLYYSNLGNLHWQLGELELAAENYRLAIEKSESRPGARSDTQVWARLDLSSVHGEVGQWARGFESAVEALYLARIRFMHNQSMQCLVAYRFMALLATYDPRASDSAAAECDSLMQFAEEPLWKLDTLERFIGVMRDSGRITYAETQLQRLQEEVDKSEHKQQFAHKLPFSEALTYESCGRYEDAIARYTHILGHSEGQQVDKWTFAAALSNRGIRLADQGRWPAAENDLRAALQRWEDYGYGTVAAVIRVELADMLRHKGLMGDAQAELATAARVLAEEITSYTADYYFTAGNIYLDQGKWIEAQQHFEKVLEVSSACRLMKMQAKALRHLAHVAS